MEKDTLLSLEKVNQLALSDEERSVVLDFFAAAEVDAKALDKIDTADVAKVPSTYVELTNEDDIENMEKMLDKFNEDDDVNAVYHNWDA